MFILFNYIPNDRQLKGTEKCPYSRKPCRNIYRVAIESRIWSVESNGTSYFSAQIVILLDLNSEVFLFEFESYF